SCGACDLCLGDTEPVADAVVIAQKILSCVARVQQRFGIGHVAAVLRGENTEGINRWGHQKLSTYGLLANYPRADLRHWAYQLIGQGVLVQEELELPSGGHVPILKLNDASWEVMHGKRSIRLLQPVRRSKGTRAQKADVDNASWEGVDQELFEALRTLRRQVAEERRVPPYIIFHDNVLRQLARIRPSSLAQMRLVPGIGDAKLRDVGDRFLKVVDQHCRERALARDNLPLPAANREPPAISSRPNAQRDLACELFRQGKTVDEVVRQTGRARSTVSEYLCDFVRAERPTSLSSWISDDLYETIATTARQVGIERLKPIFIALGEAVPYDMIRLVITNLKNKQSEL